MTTVRDLGEFGLIDRLLARLPRLGGEVVVGPGDDVAVIRPAPGKLLLATCDVQVEGVHFRADGCDAYLLGRKVVAVNVSDVAATGGVPKHLLVSLVVPPGTAVAFLERLYDGIADEASRWGADVVGGNVSGGAQLVLDVSLLGEAAEGEVLTRAGARPGDRLLVTGALGGAAAGLRLAGGATADLPADDRQSAASALAAPTPRLREARALVRAGGVHAMLDLSDGLAGDLGHLCDASRVGARIEAAALPVDSAAAALAAAAGRPAWSLALSGGEDYELLLAAPPERVPALVEAVVATGTALTDIGEVLPLSAGRLVRLPDGGEQPLGEESWRHWR